MAVKNVSTFRPMGKSALRNVERQRQMAQALQEQAMQPLRGGRMAGRVYVADSPMQGVAKLAQMLSGTYGQNKADEREAQIQADQRQAFATDISRFEDARKGTPAVAEQGNPYEIYTQQFTEDGQPIGGNTHVPAQAGIQGMSTREANLRFLMGGESDKAQKIGEQMLAESLKPEEFSSARDIGIYSKRSGEIKTPVTKEKYPNKRVQEFIQLTSIIDDPETNPKLIPGLKSQLSRLQGTGDSKDSKDVIFWGPEGMHVRNSKTGVITQPINPDTGKPYTRSQDDIAFQSNLVGSKAFSKWMAEHGAEGLANLQNTIDITSDTISTMDEIRHDKDLSGLIGLSFGQILQHIPGTEYRGLSNKIKRVVNTAYASAYETLKGGGHITVYEAQTVADSLQVIDKAANMKDFLKAFSDYENILQMGLRRAKSKASYADKYQPNWRNQQPANSGKINNQQQFDGAARKSSEGQSTVIPSPPEGYVVEK
jgi:hypothetical protein